MKRMIRCNLIGMGVLLLSACSEDKGNYDYTPIDELSITLSSFSSNVVSGGNLKITPTIEHSMEDAAENLSYVWEVDGQQVSTERNLDVMLPAMSFGEKECAFIVTDNTTGMKFIENFTITVVGKLNVGYYFMTEDEQQNTVMAFLSTASEENPNPEIVQTQACGDLSLGSRPHELNAFFSNNALAGYMKWSFILLSDGDENRCIATEGSTFLPLTLISEDNYVDAEAGYEFNPEFCSADLTGNLFFISNGQFISYSKGLLYRPARHEKEYYWSYPLPSNNGLAFYWVFDKLSHKYYAIKSITNNPELGIVGDANAYDEVVPVVDSPDLSGQQILGTFSIVRQASFVCTANQEGIRIHEFSNDDTMLSFKYDGATFLPVSGADADTKVLLVKNLDWFFFIGNQVYTSPKDMPVLSDFMTIPAEYGKVVAVSASGRQSRLVVATYDENASSEFKGSILLIDIETKKIIPYKHTIHKCVSCAGANETTNPNYGDIGDGL